MPHPRHDIDVWSVEGRFQHLIYSPRGAIEGVLIDTDGVPTQFVVDPHDGSAAQQFVGVRAGQTLTIEGTEDAPSPGGETAHWIYRFERLASVHGRPPATAAAAEPQEATVTGGVVRFNYTRHGVANGVVLDSGDFVHTRPDGLATLDLKVGDEVTAQGRALPLVTGGGRVMEARSVNGRPVGPTA